MGPVGAVLLLLEGGGIDSRAGGERVGELVYPVDVPLAEQECEDAALLGRKEASAETISASSARRSNRRTLLEKLPEALLRLRRGKPF
jgi:hypothetical protein